MDIKVLNRKRGHIKTKLTRYEADCQDMEKSWDYIELEAKSECVQKLRKEFEELKLNYYTILEDEEFQEQEQQLIDIDTRVEELEVSVKKLIKTVETAPGNALVNFDVKNIEHYSVKLPDIPLPRFDGKYEDWFVFKEQFTSLINENKLNDIQKFYYLQSALKGNAKQLQTADDTYDSLMRALEERFENKRIIVDMHVNALLNLEKINYESAKDLRSFIDNILKHVRALKTLEFESNNLSDIILINIILQKIDRESRKQFELAIEPKEVPNWNIFISFLEKRTQILESVQRNVKIDQNRQTVKNNASNKSRSFFVNSNIPNSVCYVCKMKHSIYDCKVFRNMSVSERFEFVKKHKLCFNCLCDTHRVPDCRSKNCNICKERHHTLLHFRSREDKLTANVPATEIQTQSYTAKESKVNENTRLEMPIAMTQNCLHESVELNYVLLSTAIVYVKNSSGTFLPLRALLDSASQISFVSTYGASLLCCERKEVNTSISGLNGKQMTIKKKISTIISDERKHFLKPANLFIVPKITDLTPSKTIDISKIKFPSNIRYADPNFNKSGKIDLLIGAEFFYELLLSNQIKVENESIILQNTVFGWIVSGIINNAEHLMSVQCHLIQEQDSLHHEIKKFWEIESIKQTLFVSKEEEYCEKHFKDTHFRNVTGRYVVKMPMRDNLKLGTSKEKAFSLLDRLWNRLDSDPVMKALYMEFVKEYEELGHMEKIIDSDKGNGSYYMPHHGVYKPDKTTTKLRVVFNASSVTSTGVSLNDLLMNGGVIQDDIFSILNRFRLYRYAFTADVEKMYRQILLDPEQQDFQRILWKKKSNAPVEVFKLKTVTYGTTSAPFLATRVLKQLAEDERSNFPLAAAVTEKDFYMDDLLSGASDITTAIQLQKELIQLFKSCGMKLRKWCANTSELLQLPFEEQEYQIEDISHKVKTLGLLWHPSKDYFSFKVNFDNNVFTKRSILSDIARIYDPLGFLGPVISRAKIFMQRLWLLNLDWQDSLPEREILIWKQFLSELPIIENIQINRFVLSEDVEYIELHGFSDASNSAFGAVLYLRCFTKSEKVKVKLLCSKSRVAPLKSVTIPKLELCAALLLSQLVVKVINAIQVNINKVILWSDSTITLAWINTSPHLLKIFVANRVSQIQTLTENYQWFHVATENNPADALSRGMSPSQLSKNTIWWNGPNFLNIPSLNLAEDANFETKEDDYFSELKTMVERSLLVSMDKGWINDAIGRNSKYSKIVRIISYVLRFCHNIKEVKNRKLGPLTVLELQVATKHILCHVQNMEFEEDIKSLGKHSHVQPKSKLKSLNPFVDADGILRVGGRLSKADIDYDSKHQIILPKNHKLTNLIFEEFHLNNFHAGPQALLHFVRHTFWPINGKGTARKIVHNCITCFRHKPNDLTQIMGDLPKERVNPSNTFDNSGVDFCGPFLIKYKGQRKGILHKIYVAIFICLVTKAIHLEMVTDLSTQAFIACLKRFTSRRGKISTLFSDNAKTFVGANMELRKLNSLLSSPDELFCSYMTSENISWKFIPPRAPNFGGLWEAGVKSFKHHFKRTIGNSVLTYEEFLTVMVQIEGMLNSRPISPLSTEGSDYEPLTPGHFLVGRPINAIPEPQLITIQETRLSRWQRLTQLVQQIWKRWSRDYLSHLQQRSKWNFEKKNVTPGTIVLMKEENLPPYKWLLGKVEEVILGPDKKIRVVIVKTKLGIVKRSISKICVLPIKG